MFVPVRIERLEWRRRANTAVTCHVRNVSIQDTRWFADIDVFTPEGEPVMSLIGCCCVRKPQEASLLKSATKVYREEWKPAARPAGASQPPTTWLVIDPANSAGELVRLLTGTWIGHQTGTATDQMPGFLAHANGNGAVVVWLASANGEPSVKGIADLIEPLLKSRPGSWQHHRDSLWLVTGGGPGSASSNRRTCFKRQPRGCFAPSPPNCPM